MRQIYWSHAPGACEMQSRSSAAARSGSSSFAVFKWPTKRVSTALGKLANSSQWILLECFKPSSTPTGTWVRRPSYREYTGAQTTEENPESIRTWRLTTTNTRCLRGSFPGFWPGFWVPLLVIRNKSPRSTYRGNPCLVRPCLVRPWNSSTSDCRLSSSATRSKIAASRASSSDLSRLLMYDAAARSRKADRLPSRRSISLSSELGSVTDVPRLCSRARGEKPWSLNIDITVLAVRRNA